MKRNDIFIEETIEVFMVDDNVDDIELTLQAFTESKRRFNVNVAQDGIEAMNYLCKIGEFLNRPDPDLILLDLKMPRMNGFEVLEELKKNEILKHIPVIVYSLSRNEDDILKVKSLNTKSYIIKPIGFEGILEVIKAIEMIIDGRNDLPFVIGQ